MSAKPDPYLIPVEPVRTEIIVTKSRFITSIAPVFTVDEAKAYLQQIRSEMPDASHHVYAYRIGHGKSVIESMSDAGEPSGTAGPPVLAVLRGSDIGDIIVIVTRYFGGTLLGTGGLVRAYGDAAREGLDALKTELKIAKTLLGIETPYGWYELIKRLIDEHNGEIQDESFTGDVTIMAQFPDDDITAFSSALVELTNGQVEPLILD